MKRKTQFIVCQISLFMLFMFSSRAQQVLTQLKPGDQIPEVQLLNLINYSAPVVSLSSFKGKLLILDFWNVYCTYSVEGFQRMEELQNSFKGRVQVIRITRNSENEVMNLFSRSKPASESKLPVAFADTTFTKMFPVILPHQAWIDPDGKVIAITSAKNASIENIRKQLNGQKADLPPIYFFEDFDTKKPLFVNAEIGVMDFMKQYSFFTGYINGINFPSGITIDSASKKIIRRAYYNTSVKNLVKYAYGGFSRNLFGNPADDRRIIYEVKDRARIVPPHEPSLVIPWKWQNAYCYEIQVLPQDAERMAEFMQRDIERYFNIKVNVEKRIINGLSLERNEHAVRKTSGSNSLRAFNPVKNMYILKNKPVSELISVLTSNLENVIITDHTGITDHIDIELVKTNDLQNMRIALQEYGFDLMKKQIEIDMLVIRDQY